jgi:hypothetical protein
MVGSFIAIDLTIEKSERRDAGALMRLTLAAAYPRARAARSAVSWMLDMSRAVMPSPSSAHSASYQLPDLLTMNRSISHSMAICHYAYTLGCHDDRSSFEIPPITGTLLRRAHGSMPATQLSAAIRRVYCEDALADSWTATLPSSPGLSASTMRW